MATEAADLPAARTAVLPPAAAPAPQRVEEHYSFLDDDWNFSNPAVGSAEFHAYVASCVPHAGSELAALWYAAELLIGKHFSSLRLIQQLQEQLDEQWGDESEAEPAAEPYRPTEQLSPPVPEPSQCTPVPSASSPAGSTQPLPSWPRPRLPPYVDFGTGGGDWAGFPVPLGHPSGLFYSRQLLGSCTPPCSSHSSPVYPSYYLSPPYPMASPQQQAMEVDPQQQGLAAMQAAAAQQQAPAPQQVVAQQGVGTAQAPQATSAGPTVSPSAGYDDALATPAKHAQLDSYTLGYTHKKHGPVERYVLDYDAIRADARVDTAEAVRQQLSVIKSFLRSCELRLDYLLLSMLLHGPTCKRFLWARFPEGEDSLAPLPSQIMADLFRELGQQVRSTAVEARERLFAGKVVMGSGPDALQAYELAFKQTMALIPDMSEADQLVLFKRGLSKELYAACQMDTQGKEFTDVASLLRYAHGLTRVAQARQQATGYQPAAAAASAPAAAGPSRGRGRSRSRGRGRSHSHSSGGSGRGGAQAAYAGRGRSGKRQAGGYPPSGSYQQQRQRHGDEAGPSGSGPPPPPHLSPIWRDGRQLSHEELDRYKREAGGMICYNCWQAGHRSRECPQRPRNHMEPPQQQQQQRRRY